MPKNEDFIDYYELLQVHPAANVSIIKKAYRTLMLEFKEHPDLGGSEEKSKLLNEAYNVLVDPAKRYEYDRFRALKSGEILKAKGTIPLDQIIIVCPVCETKNRVKSEESIKYAKCHKCGYKFCRSRTDQNLKTSKGKTTTKLYYSEWVLKQNQQPPSKKCPNCGQTSRLFSPTCPLCGTFYPSENQVSYKTFNKSVWFKNVLYGLIGTGLITGLILGAPLIYQLYFNFFPNRNIKAKNSTITKALTLKHLQALEKKALFYTDQKQYGVAIKEWQEVIKQSPANEKAHFNLGQLYMQIGNFSSAISELETALALMPEDASTHFALGNAYIELKNRKKGMEHFLKAIELNPYHASAYYNVGILYTGSGDYELAITHYLESLKLDPNNTDTMINLSTVYAKKSDYDNAYFHLKRAIELKPSEPDAHFNLGIVYEKMGNPSAAIKEYKLSLDYLKNLPQTADTSVKIKRIQSILEKELGETY